MITALPTSVQVRATLFRARTLRVAFLGFAVGLSAQTAPQPASDSAPSVPNDQAPSQQFLAHVTALRTAAKIPGLAVVVLRGTTCVLAEGLGHADIAANLSVTPETLFNIASVAKPIAAVVALRLVELGQIDLDRPLSTYDGYSDYRTEARAAGGVFFRDFDDDPQHPVTLRDLLGMRANGRPGTRFYYNPPAYSWASRPLAQVAKTPFSELTDRYVFKPAGMAHSARIHRQLPLPPTLVPLLALPYHVGPNGDWVPSAPPRTQGDGAAGGVISSALDLARFDRALTEGKLLTAASKAIMWTPGRAPDGSELPYGLGWFVKTLNGEKLLWHTGLWDGAYSALYLKVPGRDLTLILLANSEGLRWEQRLDEAAIERSPFVTAFLAAYPR